MKTRINGLKYNTDTAMFVGCYSIDADECRFSYTETLYYKRTNEFFVYRHGGDRCEKDISNDYWVYKPEIDPISFNEAKKWVKDHCSPNKYLTLFGYDDDSEPNKCSLASRKILVRRLNEIYTE